MPLYILLLNVRIHFYFFFNYRISSFIFICKHFSNFYFQFGFNPSCPDLVFFSGMQEAHLQPKITKALHIPLHPQLGAAVCSSGTFTLLTLSSAEIPVPP